jgi:hypothetical protein
VCPSVRVAPPLRVRLPCGGGGVLLTLSSGVRRGVVRGGSGQARSVAQARSTTEAVAEGSRRSVGQEKFTTAAAAAMIVGRNQSRWARRRSRRRQANRKREALCARRLHVRHRRALTTPV